jgi:hypothetical protein
VACHAVAADGGVAGNDGIGTGLDDGVNDVGDDRVIEIRRNFHRDCRRRPCRRASVRPSSVSVLTTRRPNLAPAIARFLVFGDEMLMVT